MNKIKTMIETNIKQILQEKYNLTEPKIVVNDIKDDKGDYAIPCFVFAKNSGISPMLFAQQLVPELISLNFIKSANAINGFINIVIDQDKVAMQTLEKIIKDPSSLANNIGKNKNYLVEYSSPNIAKPFSVGHLRTTIIGNAIKNIAIKNGYKVTSINHLGDWGTQFGKLITAYKMWGSKEMVESSPIDTLLNLYIKFHEEVKINPDLDDMAREWFKKLENGDEEAVELWKWFKNESMVEFSQTYELLDIKFDSYAGESFYSDKMQPVIDDLKQRNLLKLDNEAMIVDLGKDMPPALILKNDGATLYMTRDLAAAHYRMETYDFDKCIYVVGSEQSLHFKQLKKVLDLSGNSWSDQMVHVSFGMVLQNGKKMSTRKGKIIKLHELLIESINLAKDKISKDDESPENLEQTAKNIGIGAILYNDLKNYRTNDIEFNLENALKFEGNTGPYIQYSIVRINSILEKNNYSAFIDDAQYFNSDSVNSLLNIINNYNKVLMDSLNEYDPSLIAKYIYDLARTFSKVYSKINVSNMNDVLEKNFMLNLFNAVKIILSDGLDTLGIKSVKKM
jgi:arginyl-tRNA synthetase